MWRESCFLCRGPGSNWGPIALQASALPTELPRHVQIFVTLTITLRYQSRRFGRLPDRSASGLSYPLHCPCELQELQHLSPTLAPIQAALIVRPLEQIAEITLEPTVHLLHLFDIRLYEIVRAD